MAKQKRKRDDRKIKRFIRVVFVIMMIAFALFMGLALSVEIP